MVPPSSYRRSAARVLSGRRDCFVYLSTAQTVIAPGRISQLWPARVSKGSDVMKAVRVIPPRGLTIHSRSLIKGFEYEASVERDMERVPRSVLLLRLF